MNSGSDSAAKGSSSGASHLTHLLPILLALVLGAVVGILFGRSMWLSSGGPERQQDAVTRTLTVLQKRNEETAQKLSESKPDDRAEWEAQQKRLDSQLAATTSKAEELAKIIAERDARGISTAAAVSYKILKFLGELFLQMLKLLVLPLVVTSMIGGIGALGDIRGVGRMGRVTFLYFIITTAIAVVIGLVWVVGIHPGGNEGGAIEYADSRVESREKAGLLDTILELVVGTPSAPGSGMIPGNLFQAATSTNILALIVFSLFLGGALTTLGEKGRAAIEFFSTLNDAILQMVRLVMFVAPVGIFALVAYNIASKGGGKEFVDQVSQLGWYVSTISIALSTQAVVLMVILWLVGQRPISYTVGVGRALLTAFSTASSSATLPLTIECVEDENGVSKQSANFVLPLGATVNMNGTALYEAIAAVFIAQLHGYSLDIGQLLVISITATLAAVGAAGIPEAGLVTLVMVVTAVGLPTTGIGAILAVDWFLDRLRTTVNVFGDAVGAAVADRFVPETHRGSR